MGKKRGESWFDTVKEGNEFILRKMKEFGIENAIELSRQSGINVTSVRNLIKKELSPQTMKFEWRKCVSVLAVFFKCSPHELFDAGQVQTASEIGQKRAEECFGVPLSRVLPALDELSPREREIISLRFGLGEGLKKSLEETKEMSKVSSSHTVIIEKKAIRKMKYLIAKKKKTSR